MAAIRTMVVPLLRPLRGLFANALTYQRILPAPSFTSRQLICTSAPLLKQLMPRPKPPPETEIEESFLKGSGPGGQKINKTNSAVQLKHIPTGVVIKCQATRSRSQNRKLARQLLAQKIDDLLNGDQSRSEIVGAIKRKKKASAAKKARRKYRKLEEKALAEGRILEEGQEDDLEDVKEDELEDEGDIQDAKDNKFEEEGSAQKQPDPQKQI
ncbi:peptidyl-tRNA hydrolase domain protein [Rostrohypoxylon terebratum]|nr:peptidyl-tRNA hydrolase domain protein [Rostrohypoxylon terebratum]